MNLATKWIEAIEAQLTGKNLDEEEKLAIIAFFELAADEPVKAIDVALQVIELKPPSNIINCLGAGPVEELLVKHPHYLDELIAIAETNENLLQCLRHVDLPEDDIRGVNLLARFLAPKE